MLIDTELVLSEFELELLEFALDELREAELSDCDDVLEEDADDTDDLLLVLNSSVSKEMQA